MNTTLREQFSRASYGATDSSVLAALDGMITEIEKLDGMIRVLQISVGNLHTEIAVLKRQLPTLEN